MAAAVINLQAPVFIGTPARIRELMTALAETAVINMDSPNFIVLAQEPTDAQLRTALATTVGGKIVNT